MEESKDYTRTLLWALQLASYLPVIQNPEPEYTISFYKDQYIRKAYEFSDIFISFAT